MGKKLSQMTWIDVQKEMSIAGSPEKITQLGKDVLTLLGKHVDTTNRAEIINVEFALKRIIAEVRLWGKLYDSSH